MYYRDFDESNNEELENEIRKTSSERHHKKYYKTTDGMFFGMPYMGEMHHCPMEDHESMQCCPMMKQMHSKPCTYEKTMNPYMMYGTDMYTDHMERYTTDSYYVPYHHHPYYHHHHMHWPWWMY